MNFRAPRFHFEGLLSFRPDGQLNWNQGMTINVSSSGVLFRSNRPVEVNDVVHLIFVLPPQVPGRIGDVVSCKGQIVRTTRPDDCDLQTHMGARILGFDPFKSIA